MRRPKCKRESESKKKSQRQRRRQQRLQQQRNKPTNKHSFYFVFFLLFSFIFSCVVVVAYGAVQTFMPSVLVVCVCCVCAKTLYILKRKVSYHFNRHRRIYTKRKKNTPSLNGIRHKQRQRKASKQAVDGCVRRLGPKYIPNHLPIV